ncbi:family 14 glycosylhydrolase [Clostridium sp. CM028]|uniref:family 14 glycosylhydrolase n=1 Tax=Clostridium sp. CM028 TaxID=2851575 RepID=UPI001C6F20C0|nr:family 14 glycosylhydrolase [Clostridium sp. CM028]MBW9150058.1 family 14 glycosylhydrolase [Clostridium sp. CM028]WLC60544.1 family 14 glycosylhydrolase [Clostridium sp. CM028]
MRYVNKTLKRYGSFALSLVIALNLMLSFSFKTYASTIQSDYKSFVMAPLEKVTDWNAFKNQLITIKNNGVYALTTDVWWGDVESAGDNQFDWSYYKTYADTVRAAGLKWVPIMSTHQCGGSVGNSVNIPLPTWLWNKDSAENMQFKDEKGNYDKESLSPWWSGTDKQYNELYASFAENFSSYKDIIAKVYLSGGPSGELRFPSYNPSLGWSYPGRGSLQCYSTTAKTDFQNTMKTKYGTISAVNSAWNASLTSFTQIMPPTDGDNFFEKGYKLTYGNDFLTWYQSVLAKHLSNITAIAHNSFDSVFDVRIGAKIAGIHWLMNSPTMPHAAEYGAGYYKYSTLLDQFKTSNVDLTFTCLEMDDSNAYVSPSYSAPKSLVINVANLATSKGIRHFGENALAISNNNQAYQNAAEMLFNYNFSGFTLLRFANVVNRNGTATSEMAPFADTLVMKPVPVTFTVNNVNPGSGQNVYLSGSRWELSNWTTGVYPLPLTNSNGRYTGTTYLGEGRDYQFKAIMKDGDGNVTWGGGNSQSYTVPTRGGSYTWNW